MEEADFFRDISLTSHEEKCIKSKKLPFVLSAWECKIQDYRHFVNFENLTLANIIMIWSCNRLSEGSKISSMYYKDMITFFIEMFANLLQKLT